MTVAVFTASNFLRKKHVHFRLLRDPPPRDLPFLLRLRQLDVEIPIELQNQLANLYHRQVPPNASSGASTELNPHQYASVYGRLVKSVCQIFVGGYMLTVNKLRRISLICDVVESIHRSGLKASTLFLH